VARVFVRGAVGQDSYNENLKVLEARARVQEGKWEIIRRKMTRRLLEEQDKILRSYFAEVRSGTKSGTQRG
jgi:hypothetical protein